MSQDEQSKESLINESMILVNKRWVIGKQIKENEFGDRFLGMDVNKGNLVEIKMEDEKCKNPMLIEERGIGIPQIEWCGNKAGIVISVMELMGPSLKELFETCNNRFSLKTVLMLGEQLITRIEFIHQQSYVHRDIKPDNLSMGLARKSAVLHVLEYGLAKKYRDIKTHQHIPYKENKNLTGTARYASINSHLGIEQSRRDDLESIGYLLIHFLKGTLPWQGIKANTKSEKYHKIMECKMTTPTELLCDSLPIEFISIMNYCKSLRFEDKPDYNFIRKLIKELFIKMNYQLDYMYDWSIDSNHDQQSIINNKINLIPHNQAGVQKIYDQSQQELNQKQELKKKSSKEIIEIDFEKKISEQQVIQQKQLSLLNQKQDDIYDNIVKNKMQLPQTKINQHESQLILDLGEDESDIIHNNSLLDQQQKDIKLLLDDDIHHNHHQNQFNIFSDNQDDLIDEYDSNTQKQVIQIPIPHETQSKTNPVIENVFKSKK